MAHCPHDLSSLLLQYKLPADICSAQVSDVHLEEISRSHCKDWKNLPPHLQLDTIMASDINRMQVGEAEKRREFLFGWKESKGSDATYGSLIRALLKIKCRQDAESICELLQWPTSLISDQGSSGAVSIIMAGAVKSKSTATHTLDLREDVLQKRQHESG